MKWYLRNHKRKRVKKAKIIKYPDSKTTAYQLSKSRLRFVQKNEDSNDIYEEKWNECTSVYQSMKYKKTTICSYIMQEILNYNGTLFGEIVVSRLSCILTNKVQAYFAEESKRHELILSLKKTLPFTMKENVNFRYLGRKSSDRSHTLFIESITVELFLKADYEQFPLPYFTEFCLCENKQGIFENKSLFRSSHQNIACKLIETARKKCLRLSKVDFYDDVVKDSILRFLEYQKKGYHVIDQVTGCVTDTMVTFLHDDIKPILLCCVPSCVVTIIQAYTLPKEEDVICAECCIPFDQTLPLIYFNGPVWAEFYGHYLLYSHLNQWYHVQCFRPKEWWAEEKDDSEDDLEADNIFEKILNTY